MTWIGLSHPTRPLSPRMELPAAAPGTKRPREEAAIKSAVSGTAASRDALSSPVAAEQAAVAPLGQPKPKKQRQLTPYEECFRNFRTQLVEAAKRDDAEAALDVYDEMVRAKIIATAQTFSMILSVCTRVTGKVEPSLLEKAVRVFEAMYRTKPATAAAMVSPAAQSDQAPHGDSAAAASSQPEAVTEAALRNAAESLSAPTEPAYTCMIRLCALAGQPGEAQHFFDRMLREGVTPRLRTYAPLFQAHSAVSDAATLDALYSDLKARALTPSQLEYAAYLSALARCGRWDDVRRLLGEMSELVYVVEGDGPVVGGNVQPVHALTPAAQLAAAAAASGALESSNIHSGRVPTAAGAGSSSSSSSSTSSRGHAAAAGGPMGTEDAFSAEGVGGFDGDADGLEGDNRGFWGPSLLLTLEQLFSGQLVPAEGAAAASAVEEGAERAAAPSSSSSSSDSSHPVQPAAATAGDSGSGGGWSWSCRRVVIDPSSGVCPLTGRVLQSLELTPEELATMEAQVEALAAHRKRSLADFRGWLTKYGGPGGFDVIVDGPNVGFANQNFSGGALMYSQIDAVVREFERRRQRVLLVIGSRWMESRTYGAAEKRRPVKRGPHAEATAAATSAAARAGGSGSAAAAAAGALEQATRPAAADLVPPSSSPGPEGVVDAAEEGAGDEAEGLADTVTPEAAAALALQEEGYSTAVHGEDTDGSSSSAASSSTCVSSSLPASAEQHVLSSVATASSSETAAQTDQGASSCPPPSSSSSSWSSSTPALDDPAACDEDGLPLPGRVEPDAVSDSQRAPAIVRRWLQRDLVYRVPYGCNDDWYWLYAAVVSQAAPGNGGVTLVSNDLMRDHHFAMLAPRNFLKWRERHQARFRFEAGWDKAAKRRANRPAFDFPRRYSHRVQRSPDGNVWHFPIAPETAGGPNHWLVAWRTDVGLAAAGETADR